MKTNPESTTNHRSVRSHSVFSAMALVALVMVTASSSLASSTTLRLNNTGLDTEGLQKFQLNWDAISNATYLVQSATDLTASNAWQTIDIVTPTTTAGALEIKGRSIPENSVQFFRLILPQPKISSVEPAIVAPGVPVDLYVIGQCFPTNTELLVKGLPYHGILSQSTSTLVLPSFTPDVPGDYQVSLVISGAVVSSFTITCADPLANPELVLQGPPDPPLAAPKSRPWVEELEKLAKASGRKGLNAVNVKLARMAGGGGGVVGGSTSIIGNKRGGITLFDGSNDGIGKPDGGWGVIGGESFYAAPVKRSKSNVSNNRSSGGGRDLGTSPLKIALGTIGGGGETDKDCDGINEEKVNPTAGEQCDNGFASVIPFSGEVRQQGVDLYVPGQGLDFNWARTYRSRGGNFTISATLKLSMSYQTFCVPNGSGGTGVGAVDVYDGTGRKDTFTLQTNGVYTCPEFFREGRLSNNVFTLTFADAGYWEFNPLTTSASAGKLAKIVDRNGNTMNLSYDASGQLAQVVDDLGRTNTVTYDTSGRVTSVTDFSGRAVRYEYDTNGDLVSVISPPVTGTPNGNDFPGGKTNRYTYTSGYPVALDRQNHLLLSCVNALGTTIQQFSYDLNPSSPSYLRCISVQEWTNTPTIFSYLPQTPSPTNGFATLRCIINDPVGDVTENFFDSRGRCVIEREYTGRATPGVAVTATVNRPNGKLRSQDPDYYECRASWNNDSLCGKLLIYGGQQTQFVYQSDFDPNTPARKRADCRVVREIASSPVDLDGDGVADVTERVWHYDYDPRFGSDSAQSRTWTITKNQPAVCSRGIIVGKPGGGGTSSQSGASKTTGDFKLSNRFSFEIDGVISMTDPRGNVTTGVYDNNGNRVKVRFYWDRQSSADADFAYDTYGQLTAITNAPDANGRRSVDTFTYSQGQVVQCVADAGAGGLALTESYEYDARGNLTRCIDPRGNDWLYTYNTLDQCVRIQTPTNLTARCATDFYYDANDNLVQATAQLRDAKDNQYCGKTDHFRCNPMGQIVRIESSVDCSRFITNDFVYDGNGQCILARSPEAVNGNDPFNTVAYQYDECGLLYREIRAPGSTVQSSSQFDYDANGLVTRVSDGLEGTPSITTMEYDGFGGFGSASSQSAGTAKPGGRATLIYRNTGHFDPNGFSSPKSPGAGADNALDSIPRFMLVARKAKTSEATLTVNRPSKITDPMGNVTTCNFDANDNLKVIRHFGQTNDVPGTNGNIRLAESRYEYDALNRPLVLHGMLFTAAKGGSTGDFAKGEAITHLAYAPNGECTSVTDDLGRVTTFGYDTAGRPSFVSSPSGKSVKVSYQDLAGNPTLYTQTDLSDLGGAPQVFARTNVFDSLNRCVSTTDNVGNTLMFAYDSRGNCTSATDPNGNVTTYSYDGLSRVVNFTITQGATSAVIPGNSFVYDDNDNCTSITDPRGNSTLYTYDSLDHLIQTTRADGSHNSLVWSPRSNLISETDANGTVIEHTYDANDRCISNHITPGAGIATTTTFETFAYDGCSQLIAASNDVSSCAFIYGSDGSCVSETRDGLTTASTYDSLGNRLTLTYPGGRALSYAYNALDRCTNILETGASLVSFDYDSPSRLAKISYANGMRTRIFYDGISGTANASGDFGRGHVSHILHAMNGGSPKIGDITLAWDRNGNKLKRTDAIFQPAIPRTNTLVLGYDGVNRLTEAAVMRGTTILRDTVYGLDVAGNRTNVTGAASCSGDYTMSSTIPPGDSQMNRYSATPCDTRTYDANGNLASRSSALTGPTTYQYDYAGRLVLVQALDFNVGALAPVASYSYDALGRRISKTVYPSGVPSITKDFLFDGRDVIEERSGGAVAATYVMRCYGAGQPHPQTCDSMRIFGKDYFFHTDDQGNTLALTKAGGSVVERYDYDDYGAVTFLLSDGTVNSANVSAVGNTYCWHGLRLDAETGLQNNDSGGYFEPQTGRSLSVPAHNLNGSGRNAGKVTIKVVNPDNQESNDFVVQGNNPWSPEVCDGPDDDDADTVKVTLTNSVGTSTAVTGGR